MVSQEDVIQKLKKVIDPHTGINVYDMGLIKDINVKDEEASLTFLPSSPYCPLGVQLAFAIKDGLKGIKSLKKVDVTVEGHVQEDQLNEMLKKR